MNTAPRDSSRQRPLRRRIILAALFGYPLYLLLLGPYLAFLETGHLDALPQHLRDTPFYPAAPITSVPGIRNLYDGYLTIWYHDPNAADMPTGW